MPGNREIHAIVRYEPVLRLIREIGASGELLEVGSGHLGLRGYGLSERGWSITVLESDETELELQATDGDGGHCVLGDVRELPFEDDAFELTVALDLLEHVRHLAAVRRWSRWPGSLARD